MKKTIKRGARYQDGWGRTWFVVCYDDITDMWLMRLCNYPAEGWFKTENIHNWKLISP
jgi:hypothetical protein